MKLLQLYYFKALAEREHLTATAAELYISPPSLSAAISRLETDLGVPLFDRVGRNIRLNDKGRQFYDHVKLALDELDKGFDELQSTAAWNRNLSLRVATSTHIIWEKPFAEAKDEPFVAHSKGFSMRKYFDLLCKKAGFQPKVVAEADYSLRARLVKNEYGIALSTRTGAESIYLSGLKFIPLSEPVDTRVQTLFWRKDRKLSPQAEVFRDFLTEYFASPAAEALNPSI